ncbi:hypothetical protein HKCCE3408_13390 [Rhodobacterales bacterium HKCCE3408]|nr:hypothetical protein [Rhodobacterales bacterium HKCCE3408]
MTGTDIAVLLVAAAAALVLCQPRVSGAESWRAVVTPLASIIGSGFLVLGPLLDLRYGAWAPAVMAALCLTAYAFGSAIRVNIARIDRDGDRPATDERLEQVASWILSAAYVISVAYYLNLFGSFAVDLTPVSSEMAAHVVTSAAYALILFTGWTRGFGALEWLEKWSVAVKLAIITGLLAGLVIHLAQTVQNDALVLNPVSISGFEILTIGFGLIVTVQGFETSRYLGETYSAERRIRSMRQAQWLAAAIYMAYLLLTSYVFPAGQLEPDETAIIDMMRIVAVSLPPLLVAAALAAQFSAAVADTAGAGGLLHELTGGRVTEPMGYAVLVAAGVAMTWTLHVFEIIAYASRAFALYYALQAVLAARAEWQAGRNKRALAYGALAVLGGLVTIFGRPPESA